MSEQRQSKRKDVRSNAPKARSRKPATSVTAAARTARPAQSSSSTGSVRPPRGDVRETILAAATRLLAARGFEGTTLQAVADEVGIRKPSVLHHFPSKEALREGVIDAMLTHFRKVLPHVLQSAGESQNRFESLTREMVRFFAEDPDRARLLVRETMDRPREIRRLFAEHVRPWLSVIAGFVRDGQKQGTHHADLDPDAYLVHMLHLIVVGIALGGVLIDRPVRPLKATGPKNGTEPHEPIDRDIRELLRIARTSLFATEASAITDERPTPARRPTARPGSISRT